jgi:HEAT repeat protein
MIDRVEKLIKQLNDDNVDVRQQAVIELGKAKNPRAFEPLVKALYDVDNRVRRSAITAMSQLGDVRAVRAMGNTYLGDGPSIRLDIPVMDSREATQEDIEFVARAILQIGPAVLDTLTEIAEKEGVSDYPANDRFRWQAALMALWLSEDQQAVATIDRLPQRRSWFVRWNLVDFLSERGDERAVRLLVELLGDDSWQFWDHVINDMGNNSGTARHQMLMKILDQVEPRVKEKALEVLRNKPSQ